MAECERTLHNLHVLGAISHNDKLLTNGDNFDIYSPTSVRGAMRMWHGENRMQNIRRVRQTVTSGMAFATLLFGDAESFKTDATIFRFDTTILQYRRMCDALQKASIGLSNLQQTYRDDMMMSSQINLLVEEIDDFRRVSSRHSARHPSHLQLSHRVENAVEGEK